ncbi:hypothetical protein NDU88_002758 [Pleurodeles waltl]|uniref:Uncharacterized protein n=1 Tax=Pleurodeles waltl TaxID=8319 RepID=A0AAV7Q6Z4_PLEWA|nr:hypothetical protein NDU88_002758 [Pleurodeles waltl]
MISGDIVTRYAICNDRSVALQLAHFKNAGQSQLRLLSGFCLPPRWTPPLGIRLVTGSYRVRLCLPIPRVDLSQMCERLARSQLQTYTRDIA